MPVNFIGDIKKLGFKKGDFPSAERYSQTAMSLPIYPDLKIRDQKKIVKVLKIALN